MQLMETMKQESQTASTKSEGVFLKDMTFEESRNSFSASKLQKHVDDAEIKIRFNNKCTAFFGRIVVGVCVCVVLV